MIPHAWRPIRERFRARPHRARPAAAALARNLFESTGFQRPSGLCERLAGFERHRTARHERGQTTSACRSGCVYARPSEVMEPAPRPSAGPTSTKRT